MLFSPETAATLNAKLGLTASLALKANLTALNGTGRVIQVVSATCNTITHSSSATYADTGLTATITPTASTSKVLVMIKQNGCSKDTSNTTLGLKILRGATSLGIWELDGAYTGNTSTNYIGTCGVDILDTPATTSATTYKTQFNSSANATETGVQTSSAISSITLIEVG